MKCFSTAVYLAASLLVLVLPPCSRAADTNTAREYRDAMLAHDRAIAAATAPENKSYQGTLATLIRHAQLEGDFDTAARIQQAMASLAEQVKASSDGPGKSEVVGTWKLMMHDDPGVAQTLEVRPDGTVLKEGIEHATWVLKDNQLQITYASSGWKDNFDLPVRNGQMSGHNKAGAAMTFFREGTPLPRTVLTAPKSDFLGTWFLDTAAPNSRHYVTQICEDGTWSSDHDLKGTWTVDNGYFNLRFDGHPDYLDRYRLPIRNGELRGKNLAGTEPRLRRNVASGSSQPGDSSYFGSNH